MSLTIVAQITAVAGKEDLVRTKLTKLVDITRTEAGCLQYDLHADSDSPGFFVFYETWENRELWQTHMSSPHLAAYMQAADGAVASFVLNEMARFA